MRVCSDFLGFMLVLSALWVLPVVGQEIRLQQTPDFGYNPGNLEMYSYVSDNLSGGEFPLVVVLHGCTQSAREVALQTGWNKLADSLRFFVLYAQTDFGNNVTSCFRWFREKDIATDEGECRSIYEMIHHFKKTNPVDTSQIFVTGLSAGGAMSVAMLARYPDLFKAGAIVAGGPFGAAFELKSAKKAMRGKIEHSQDDWAELVRSQNPHFKGEYPTISVFHGAKDRTVRPVNAEHLIAQWTGLYHSEVIPAIIEQNFNGHSGIEMRQYNNHSDKSIARLYILMELKHALSIATGDALDQGGKIGRFTVNTGFHIPWQCAVDFGLTEAE